MAPKIAKMEIFRVDSQFRKELMIQVFSQVSFVLSHVNDLMGNEQYVLTFTSFKVAWI